ncbi:MAG TPA: hypothetical protein VFC65_06975 [Prolixibacteraceae bacterium]|nr:hypothetical protein [Prolixibacteraceae bacterium]
MIPKGNLLLTIIAVFAFQIISLAQEDAIATIGTKVFLHDNKTWVDANNVHNNSFKANTITKLEIPKINGNEVVISHIGYSLLYNEAHEQASWVAYELTRKETNKLYDRTDKFIVDLLVKQEIHIPQETSV